MGKYVSSHESYVYSCTIHWHIDLTLPDASARIPRVENFRRKIKITKTGWKTPLTPKLTPFSDLAWKNTLRSPYIAWPSDPPLDLKIGSKNEKNRFFEFSTWFWPLKVQLCKNVSSHGSYVFNMRMKILLFLFFLFSHVYCMFAESRLTDCQRVMNVCECIWAY